MLKVNLVEWFFCLKKEKSSFKRRSDTRITYSNALDAAQPFNLASITKQFVATMTMKLFEQGNGI
jgi:hypothetical protein